MTRDSVRRGRGANGRPVVREGCCPRRIDGVAQCRVPRTCGVRQKMTVPALLWQTLSGLGVDRLPASMMRASGWTILWGHGVCSVPSRWHRYDPRHIPVETFERQMEFLISRGYSFITLDEGLRLIGNADPLDRKITLTFDDGFRNVVQLAYPIMRRLNLKGCFFVVAGLVDTDRIMWTDMIDVVCRWHQGRHLDMEFPDGAFRFGLENDAAVARAIFSIKRRLRSLSDGLRQQYFGQIETFFAAVDADFIPDDFRIVRRDDIRALDPAVLEVGNHTMTHPQLTKLENPQQLRWEIREAKERLESWTQWPVRHFCYPAGAYDSQTLIAVEQEGHVSGLTVKHGTNGADTSSWELKRLALAPSVAQFKCRIGGVEAWLLSLKVRLSSLTAGATAREPGTGNRPGLRTPSQGVY